MKKFIFSVFLLSAVWVQASDGQQHLRRRFTKEALEFYAEAKNLKEVIQLPDGNVTGVRLSDNKPVTATIDQVADEINLMQLYPNIYCRNKYLSK